MDDNENVDLLANVNSTKLSIWNGEERNIGLLFSNTGSGGDSRAGLWSRKIF